MEGNRDNEIYQYFSQGSWNMAEIKNEWNFHRNGDADSFIAEKVQ